MPVSEELKEFTDIVFSLSERSYWNRCDDCGRFIAYADFEDGSAVHDMISADTDFSSEDYTTICKKCNGK